MDNIDALLIELEKDILKSLEKGSETIGKIIQAKIRDVIVEKNLIASKELYNSVTYKVEKVYMDYLIRVFSLDPKAIYVEEGGKPHMPPVQSIAKWIMLKKRVFGVNDDSSIKRLAWAIANSIKYKGTVAYKFFDLGLKGAVPLIEDTLNKMEFSNG